MKRIMQPIAVHSPDTPGWTLTWQVQTFRVESVLQRWFFRGKWWLDPSLEGERRTYYRLSCLPVPPKASPRLTREVPGPYSMAPRKPHLPTIEAPPRVFEVFHQTREGTEAWVLSRVVD